MKKLSKKAVQAYKDAGYKVSYFQGVVVLSHIPHGICKNAQKRREQYLKEHGDY